MATDIRPLDDRVVVEVLDAEEKTAGGIVLPDTAKERPHRGKITAVGEGKLGKSGKRSPMSVKKGDTVIFGKYSGTDITVDDVEFKIMRENEILARLD